ncbi:ABC transporter ATP-binding protein [Rhodococcus triatomae]|uniref:Branched-chain amino acid transport system ATP-binding protein n=1 Tax=Rhodococcus triatomae TaxID=300028 RepID=A0A1G8L907_9NOCA|nr:ABC transporter ATP-binding protein [Rhodococcus triatomae]QNG20535.1 ABC transporter ATP-binding protein [Rhodococcus triatomae]QNG23547.1 ABC transporter ATP-binding protein [Rhodococcus triatomae]SDI52102.1 branched-chain amino acid transport system ATP-binding protein [Rhodococcus triatomae]
MTATTGTRAALEIEGLTVRYGPITALGDVRMSVPEGAVTAILGANGAGKTTLLRTISGLLTPVAGSIRMGGRELVGVPAERMSRRGMSHVPEGRGVIAEMTVEENLRLGALGRYPAAPPVSLDDVYTMFPSLDQRRKAEAHTLSGGERQMLVIGRALMATPSLLLLDEPSLGLAPLIVEQIFDALRRLVESRGLTVVLVEQNARSALSIAEHAVVLELGKVALQGTGSELVDDEQLRHAYLGF